MPSAFQPPSRPPPGRPVGARCGSRLQICGFLVAGLDGLFRANWGPVGSWHKPRTSNDNAARGSFIDVIDKQVKTTADAVAGVRDGSTVLVAGFGAVGVADHLLDALHEQGARELTIVANNSGNGDYGLARLINSGRVRKVICSFPRSGDYSAFLNAYRAKSLELELVPQGTISERMRCAAAGLGGFFSPVSAHTKLAEGKETREIDGQLHVFEKPLKGDVALLKANKADRWGNLTYIKSARNFNPVMAMAAELTVVEVDQMVELGEMDPEAVVTPSIFVDRIVVVGANA